jgi:hypothetical protein
MFNVELIGNLHVHTTHSDGGAGVSEIALSASRVGLDFVCANDHSYMTDVLHLEEEGFYGKVLVLVGLEIGLRYHHYLAFGLETRIPHQNPLPQEMIDWVNGQGGFGFMAHPFEKGMPFVEKSTAYTWNDLSVSGQTGLCLWNFTSRWKERVKTFFHGIVLLNFKTQTLGGPSGKTLDYWDRECLKRRFVAVGGSDAHGSVYKWGPFALKPFAYDYLLNSINIHIFLSKKLSRDFHEAKAEVYGAMKEGRLFIAHDNLCPARGFRFYFLSSDGSDLYMGEEGNFQPGQLVMELPSEGEIRLVKDGELLQKWRGKEAVYQVNEKGVYRVEVYRRLFFFGWRPWIFSNPIYLR